ncbi:hypothetical protein FPCIR_12696 [Fusarium pseudocircinatum]|uniref:Uncharacterized protein n=1 Tax=Fusarium pseudocircinatum TaxID=56676 RepID=A0A8H5KLV5_9HYPO|nr:hypothetical protein FPCIR_12696 [Fusarium pseudocircinatum]
MDNDAMYSPTFEPPFVIDKTRDRLQARLHKDHLEGYLLINLPNYDPTEALKAAMSLVKDMDMRMLKKPHISDSSTWVSLTGHPWCHATTLSRGIHFALPLSAVRENDCKASHVPPVDVQQDKSQEIVVSPPLKPLPVGVKGTKRARPEDGGDEQRSLKRPDPQGFTGWFPWSSTSPKPRSEN